MTTPPIVVMGVSGSGKTTVGQALAARLHVEFEDGDALHPAANIAKMSAGIPLDDADRAPWLAAVGNWLAEHADGCVMACSALKRAYRDTLRSHAPHVVFIELDADPRTLTQRVATRKDHFMPASLVQSQLQTLEPLARDEAGIAVDSDAPVAQIVDACMARLNDPQARLN